MSDRDYVAAVIHHDAWNDLPECLASLSRQTLPPSGTLVLDSGTDPERLAMVQSAHGDLTFATRPNRGWGAGVNQALAWCARHDEASPFVLLLNPDVVLGPRYVETLMMELLGDSRIAVAGGKLLRMDGATIDSAGIVLPRHRRPRDRGSQEADRGQYDQRELVFAVSGAAMLVRREAMEEIAIEGEVVDETFFAYFDDTDLCWRATRFGWKVLYEPAATALHRRGWKKAGRFDVSPIVRRHSFKNHWLQIAKNETATDLVRNLPWLLGWEVIRLGFALARDRAMLRAYVDGARAVPEALRRRRLIAHAINRSAPTRRDVPRADA